jgi:response regulator RpfG family c-di-GMP phosphodiesterase
MPGNTKLYFSAIITSKEDEIMDQKFIKALLIEDNPGDAFLVRDLLADKMAIIIDLKHVSNLTAGIGQIRAGGLDIVLLDLGLPESHGIDTLKLLLPEAGNLPVIVLTGLSDNDTGALAVNNGAQDYLIKGDVSSGLLVRSILHAIERKKMENEKEKLLQELRAALAKVKLLSGFLPICASCKKIRDDKGYWQQIEGYISEHSEAEFSHGLCNECAKRLYPGYYKGV